MVVQGWCGARLCTRDAPLTGPRLGSSSRFQDFLIARGSLTASPCVALQTVAVPGSGSEAITIFQRGAGTYRLSVHHPVDGLSTTSSRVSLSNAQVRIYVGSSTTPVIFNVSPGRPGTLWTVCEMDGATGAITPVNSLTFVQDPTAVQ